VTDQTTPRPTIDDLPEGTVTVLFSDVEGSTDLRTREGDDIAQEVMRTHERLLREQLPAYGGREVVFMGDGFMVAFASARKALECAVAIQRAFEGHNLSGPAHAIRVRIGLNSGEVLRESGTLYGTAVNAAARISAKASGEQILVSQVTRDLTAGVRDLSFVDRGMFSLKGFPNQFRLSELSWREGAPASAVAVETEPVAAPAPRRMVALEETFVRPAAAPMVGRAIERAAIDHDLEAVVGGTIRVLAIEGEPGIGKTRLMETAIEAAAARGFGVVMVGGDEELRGPFFLLRTLLGSASIEALADKATAREALERARGVLRGGRENETGLTPAEQTLRVYDVATVALRQIAEACPLLLLFDDLQWGDEDSIKLIRYLVRTSAQSPVLIMLAQRPDPGTAPSAATMLIADLDRMRLVQRMKLERLTRTETAELLENLLGHPVSTECASTLHARGEGVPFFIVEFAQTFRQAGMFQLVGGRMEVSGAARATVAPSVQILIERRLGQLPSGTREALSDAAVIGRRFRLADLVEVRGAADPGAREPAAVLADELAPALEANLLAALPEGAAYDYGFTHDEVRAVLQLQGNKQRHRAIHGGLVKLMSSDTYDDACLSTIAFHALEAGDQESGVRYSIKAAKGALATFAPEEALRAVDAARRASASPEDRSALLCLRDDALDALGLPEERLATLSEMSAFASALGDEGLDLEVTLRRASATRQSGDQPRAADIALEAVAKAEERGDQHATMRAYIELGQARLGEEIGESFSPPMGDGVDIEGAEDAYERAWQLALELDDLPKMAAIRREQGVIEVGKTRKFIHGILDQFPDMLKDPNLDPHDVPEIVAGFERFRELAGEAVEMFERLGDQRGVMSSLIAFAYANLIEDTQHGHAGRVEQIRRLRRNLKRLTSESEQAQSEAYMLYSIHVYARGHGPADLELSRGIETHETARALGNAQLEFLAAGGVALAYAGIGDIPEAASWLDKAGTAALTSADVLPERQLETWRGLVRAAAKDPIGMRKHLERALMLASERGSPAGRCELLALLATGAARFGADGSDDELIARAEVWATEAIKLAHALPPSDAPWEGQAEAALAQVALARGDRDGAMEHGMASMMELRRTRQLFAFLNVEWRLLTARALDGIDDPLVAEFRTGARRDLQMTTHETADDTIRAKWLRMPIIRELGELVGISEPLRTEQSGATVPVGVSERGLEVLRRVMAGQTNKEIGAALELTEAAVAEELAGVYRELGVATQAQASIVALREGIA